MCSRTQNPDRTGQEDADVIPADSPGPQRCGEETVCLWGRCFEQSPCQRLLRTNPGPRSTSERHPLLIKHCQSSLATAV